MNENTENKPEGHSRRDFFRTSATGLGVAAVVATGTAGVVCALNPTPKPKVASTIGQVIRRVKQAIVPTQASIRYDGEVKMWAVLDKDLKPIRHFLQGTLTDVKFDSKAVTHRLPGCGSGTKVSYAGIASGILRENHMGTDHLGYRNLKFKEGSFLNYQEEEIKSAHTVVLLPDRHAIYKA